MDTNTVNPTVSPTAIVRRRPRLKDAIADGICDGTKSAVKIIDSGAEVIGAVATRIKLHNIATACDLIEEYPEQIKSAQELLKTL